ncbi:S41 family peptidase [Croceicoccus sp. Ery15]|uniref:S41 family peptidase n=1 Tax=Croceicoccus sp. Ery15 TaxID=1703338 RepID=UPI001E346032|nr:S41 family peptidase [Croceicoccus sp. Ery15]
MMGPNSQSRRAASRSKAMTGAGNALGALAMVLALTGCGGGGGGSGSGPTVVSPSPTPTPTPTPTNSTCSLSNRQAWVKAALDEWYLFPDLLATNVNASTYTDLQSYIDALVAPARAESKDRFFTYVTSIEEEEAYYASGSTAGIGALLALDGAGRLWVREAYENAPAFAAGMDRGTEITAIGTSTSNLVTVTSMDYDQLVDALGPSDVGVARVMQFTTAEGQTFTRTVTKDDYDIEPLSPRYGAKVLDTPSGKVGYVHLRTFIEPAQGALRTAFAGFKAQGVTNVIVDVRYNGGGLVSTAQVLGGLLNAGNIGKVFSTLELRASKASQNDTYYFEDESGAISAAKVAFIGTSSSASASELIMNAQIPYSGGNAALIGSNTYGKPVGQFAFDRDECDDRLRAVTFRTANADGDADYFTGMASVMDKTCRASDDLGNQLGSVDEASIATATGWIGGNSCTAITAGGQGTLSVGGRTPMPARPNIAQIEMPGLF